MNFYSESKIRAVSRKYDVNADLNKEAVVVSINKDSWILALENADSSQERFFKMPLTSTNVSHKGAFPRMREYVKIREVVVDVQSPSSKPSLLITKFEYIPRGDRVYTKEEVMAVAEVHENYIILVGKSIFEEVHVCIPQKTSSFSVGQLVIGNLVELPRFVKVCKSDDGVVQYKHSFQIQTGTHCPRRVYPENVRPLNPAEESKVRTRCVHVPDIQLCEAQRFIQEPLIAAGLLEKYLQYQEVLKYAVTTDKVNLRVVNGTPTFSFYVDVPEYTKLFQIISPTTWRLGGELQVVHKMLGKAEMVVKNVDKWSERYRIELVSTTRSRDVLMAVFLHQNTLEGDFMISPMFSRESATIEALKANFDEFFLKRRAMFDQCTGRIQKSEVEVKDRDEPFLVNGKPLDGSQLDFMRSAASIPGFTCAQAPPGCGKTHTTSALVSCLSEMKVKGGICISGTTNAAVTNAADAVLARFPEIRIAREYSAKAEVGITAASQKASLKHMAEEAEKYVDLDKQKKLKKDLKMMQYAKENLNNLASNLSEQLSLVEDAVSLEKSIKKSFMKAYDIQVYATTVELLIRRGDVFRGRRDEEDKSLRRLILDEAAQMSPLEAMALYCIFPHLEYVTLLGDMKQLGPHCSLPQYSMCHKLLSEGELTRMYKLASTAKKELNTIYRCHPVITQKLLVPIYGPQIKCGVSAAARNIANEHNLLRAGDGSPCVLIDVEGREVKGRNEAELRTALDLIFDIVDVKGVPAKDVVVICNHKAQMNGLNEGLKDRGEFGVLKTLVAVHTVDSFQGKEAKVVIVLTTKTCSYRDDGKQKMMFVGDAARGTVAVSRAQHALYILGHWNSLAKTEFWSKYLNNNVVIPAEIMNCQLKPSYRPNMWQPTYLVDTTALLSGLTLSRPRNPFNAAQQNFFYHSMTNAYHPMSLL